MLGGGTIPSILTRLYPESTIHVVEIDPAVVRVAKKYFSFTETENVKVFVQDARVYIKRAGLKNTRSYWMRLMAITYLST